jgi:hypothetical protein
MASSNGNEGKDPRLDKQVQVQMQMQKQLKERKQEMQMFDRFKRIASLRLEAMTRQSEESGIKYQMGDQEKQVFRQMHGMGIKEGIAAGAVTFFVLRRGPIYIGRWVYNRKLAQQRPHQQQQRYQQPSASAPPPGDGSYQLSNPNSKNPFQVAQRTDFPRSRNFLVRTIWFTFDSVLSFMMAASISMAYTVSIIGCECGMRYAVCGVRAQCPILNSQFSFLVSFFLFNTRTAVYIYCCFQLSTMLKYCRTLTRLENNLSDYHCCQEGH